MNDVAESIKEMDSLQRQVDEVTELRAANVKLKKVNRNMAEDTEPHLSLLASAEEANKGLEEKLRALTDELVAVSTASQGKP